MKRIELPSNLLILFSPLLTFSGWLRFLQLEQLQGRCDPSPSEYTDADSKEPNLVFYWGLKPGRSNPLDVQSLEDDFLTNLKGYQVPVGSLKLSLAQASEMPRDVDLPARSKKGTKACWKVYGENEQRVPLFSQHHPHYMIGYMADAQGTPNTSQVITILLVHQVVMLVLHILFRGLVLLILESKFQVSLFFFGWSEALILALLLSKYQSRVGSRELIFAHLQHC